MDSLPYLLAGPIVRRVEQKRVCVWLATREYAELRLELYIDNTLFSSRIIASPALQLGEDASLWVYLLQLEPQDNEAVFPFDQVIHYKIYNQTAEHYVDLSDVTFTGEAAPSFVIASQLQVIAYGSCRKPHGLSKSDTDESKDRIQKSDSLALLSQQLEADFHSPQLRPSILCLSGDQIYADDVLSPVMHFLQQSIKQLFSYDIQLDGQKKTEVLTFNQRETLKTNAGLSSNSGNHHLLSFAEYASMYLFVLGNHMDLSMEGLNEDFPGNEAAEQSLRGFIDSLPEVRKLLANISTYMIFDDHDVSDDWNITRLWHDRVQSNNNGQRIVSNALAAYWIFQAWGNDPSRFSKRFIDSIIGHLQQPSDEQKAQLFDSSLWKMHQWNYIIPSNPPILVLDTRTQRDFGGYNDPPQLMNYSAMDQLRADILHLKRNNQLKTPPLIISATPVLGYSTIETLQKAAYRLGLLFGNQTGKFTADNLDLESWVANKQGFSRFLTSLSRLGLPDNKVVFLSGDVHYSFVHRGQFRTGHNSDIVLNCEQLTSSALRNAPDQARLFARLLANNRFTETQGPRNPESLPWWEQQFFWRFLNRPRWTLDMQRIDGKTKQGNTIGRTSRPNVALLYFSEGKIQQQVLLSGDNKQDYIQYNFD